MDILKRVFARAEPERQVSAAFREARNLAGKTSSRQVVVIRPDLSLLALACPDAGSIPENVLQQVESIVPSSVKRNIAVVTETVFAPAGSKAEVGSPAWIGVGKDLPFFGILNGLGCIGHTVWIFDVSADLGIACNDADILIIDGAVSERIPEASLDVARGVIRTPNIFVHDRQTFHLRPLRARGQKSVGWDTLLDEARARTTRGIVFVRADQSLLYMPCIPRKAMTRDQLANAHRVIPEGVPRNVAVIASTELVSDPLDSQTPPAVALLRAAGRTIPFFGLLLNLASAGNPTWIFDGSRETLVPGCRNADLLFIDSGLADKIPMKALDEAAGAMRSANIAVYDRNSRKIALLRSLGSSIDKLVFRD
jgi:hypothetical protein